jgi:N4-(beta-N-acetylglucosaminyl)-L-asparaginase
MHSRRKFIRLSALGAAFTGSILKACVPAEDNSAAGKSPEPVKPVVVSTWNHGQGANAAAWEILSHGGTALDAAEAGVRVTEADPDVMTVGLGGFPDRNGIVTLDACIMNEKGDCGSVAFLQNIKHPISVARKVMEETPHVMLVGEGALEFALDQGFEKENLLTPKAEAAYQAWKAQHTETRPEINIENHDTIGLLTLDQYGNLSGACTTSGAAYKYHGRVGDSPIIGAGIPK